MRNDDDQDDWIREEEVKWCETRSDIAYIWKVEPTRFSEKLNMEGKRKKAQVLAWTMEGAGLPWTEKRKTGRRYVCICFGEVSRELNWEILFWKWHISEVYYRSKWQYWVGFWRYKSVIQEKGLKWNINSWFISILSPGSSWDHHERTLIGKNSRI